MTNSYLLGYLKSLNYILFSNHLNEGIAMESIKFVCIKPKKGESTSIMYEEKKKRRYSKCYDPQYNPKVPTSSPESKSIRVMNELGDIFILPKRFVKVDVINGTITIDNLLISKQYSGVVKSKAIANLTNSEIRYVEDNSDLRNMIKTIRDLEMEGDN